MTMRTNKSLILEAVEDLHNLEQTVTRTVLQHHTGLKLTTIDDHLKNLVNDGLIYRVQTGVFVPAFQHPPARPVSVMMLPDGTTIHDIGDDVIKLTPREQRMHSALTAGFSAQAAQVEQGQQQSRMIAEMASQIRNTNRQISELQQIIISMLNKDEQAPESP